MNVLKKTMTGAPKLIETKIRALPNLFGFTKENSACHWSPGRSVYSLSILHYVLRHLFFNVHDYYKI